jgi:hypothetical protein
MLASLCRRVYTAFLCDGCCGRVKRWLSMSPLEIAPLLDSGGLCCDEWETARNGPRFGNFQRLTDAHLVRPSFCEAYKHGIEIVVVLFLNYKRPTTRPV